MKRSLVLPIHAWALVALVLAPGCGSDEPKRGERPPPSTFEPTEEPGRRATVFLRGQPAEGERVVLDVVLAHDLSRELYGAAFRLSWDSAKLGFHSARPGAAWSVRSLALAKEGAPGELVVVWTEKGDARGFLARRDTVLGTIELTRRSPGSAEVSFRPERSVLQDPAGVPHDVIWSGGVVEGASTPTRE